MFSSSCWVKGFSISYLLAGVYWRMPQVGDIFPLLLSVSFGGGGSGWSTGADDGGAGAADSGSGCFLSDGCFLGDLLEVVVPGAGGWMAAVAWCLAAHWTCVCCLASFKVATSLASVVTFVSSTKSEFAKGDVSVGSSPIPSMAAPSPCWAASDNPCNEDNHLRLRPVASLGLPRRSFGLLG